YREGVRNSRTTQSLAKSSSLQRNAIADVANYHSVGEHYCCAVPFTTSANGTASPDASFSPAEKIQWSWSSLLTAAAVPAPSGCTMLKGPGCLVPVALRDSDTSSWNL